MNVKEQGGTHFTTDNGYNRGNTAREHKGLLDQDQRGRGGGGLMRYWLGCSQQICPMDRETGRELQTGGTLRGSRPGPP